MTIAAWSQRVLDQLSGEVRQDLSEDVHAAIELHFGLTVTPAESFDERGAGGWCDGVSIIKSKLILYRTTASRRENFTILHELGHHLVDNDMDCLSWMADQPNPERVLEQVCDHIAADLLVPPGVIDHTLQGSPPDANAVFNLFAATSASRSACVVAIARRLPCDGFVALIEEGSDLVFFAARSGNTRPYAWRGDPLPDGHPLRRTVLPERTRTWWPYTVGSERRQLFMSTATQSGWTVAVLAENNLFDVPGFHFSQPIEDDRGYNGHITCPCGYSGKTRWWPCKECNVPQCPKCGECDCARRNRQRVKCDNCFMAVLPHLIVEGLCDACR